MPRAGERRRIFFGQHRPNAPRARHLAPPTGNQTEPHRKAAGRYRIASSALAASERVSAAHAGLCLSANACDSILVTNRGRILWASADPESVRVTNNRPHSRNERQLASGTRGNTRRDPPTRLPGALIESIEPVQACWDLILGDTASEPHRAVGGLQGASRFPTAPPYPHP